MRRRLEIAAIVALVVVLASGVARIARLRLRAGDAYPRYSALRSDPLGSGALFQALGGIRGRTVSRSYRPLASLAGSEDLTVVLAGQAPSIADDGLADARRLARQGARVIVAFEAPLEPSERVSPSSGRRRRPTGRLGVTHTDRIETATLARAAAEHEPGLPPSLPWRASSALENPGSEWTVVYESGPYALVVMREEGSGSIVALADAYLLSNEGLQVARSAAFLSWLIGPSRRIVFDESHLGVREPSGVMILARRYGLMGFFAGAALLLSLALWRAALPFAPLPRASGPAHATAIDAATGLASLLRRALPAQSLGGVAADAWIRSMEHRIPADLAEDVRRLARESAGDVEGYEAIRSHIDLNRRKIRRTS